MRCDWGSDVKRSKSVASDGVRVGRWPQLLDRRERHGRSIDLASKPYTDTRLQQAQAVPRMADNDDFDMNHFLKEFFENCTDHK